MINFVHQLTLPELKRIMPTRLSADTLSFWSIFH